MTFHNPYHFVPVRQRSSGEHDLPVKAFEQAAVSGDAKALGHIAHHRFAESRGDRPVYHGRILCRLENEDPFFVGARRSEKASDDRPAVYIPYESEDGRPAIPASSLRGLISAIAEAASESALRVLQDGPFSRRALANRADPLRELGEVVEIASGDGAPRLGVRPFHEKQQPIALRAYRNTTIEGVEQLERDPASPIPVDAKSYSADNREFWYLSRDEATQRFRLHPEAESRESEMPAGYRRGVLRILGIRGRERNLPTTRLSELFIPYPREQESVPALDAEAAIEQFHAQADECTKRNEELPFQVAGAQRNDRSDAADHRLRLRPGDLVYFARDPQNPNLVTEVALSAIWRKGIGGTRHEFFSKVSEELLPFSRARKSLSPAELVFGFVEAREKGERDEQAWGLAGRVRFSAGRLVAPAADDHYLAPVILKVLDSPKPPYPALYFKNRAPAEPGFIAKEHLSLGSHVPQGRKFYLHRHAGSPEPWKTHPDNERETLTQKSRITPVRRNRVFYFHLDFDNLSAYELGMLCYALRPTLAFRHKIGMGKSIGLGRVKIDPVGLFLIDRTARYGADDPLRSQRYHRIGLCGEIDTGEWPAARYRREIAEARNASGPSRDDALFDTMREGFRAQIDPSVSQALALLGDPTQVVSPVHTPQVEGRDGAELERESYRWFVENRSRQQYLSPLDEQTSCLPTLER